MTKELPKFRRRNYDDVVAFAVEALTQRHQSEESYFRKLSVFPEGYYRLAFDLSYFAESSVPTKSQWNSLKKKLKRHDKNIFVFKEYGVTPPDSQVAEKWGYVDFGFFAEPA